MDLKKRAFLGVGALVIRSLLMQPVSFLGFFFLSVFLQRWELGVFWAVSEVIGLLGYFSDVGLAAALIQKKEKPEKKEIRATFTIQQILVLGLIGLALALTPFLEKRFGFGSEGRLLFYSLLFGFFAASLKTIPSVKLERKLKFEKLALVDLIEQIVFTGLAVFLAWKGWGIKSWVGAVLARSAVGLVLIYSFSPWPIGLSFDFKTLKGLISFGIPFQINSLLAVVKDRLVNIFLWGIVASEGIGVLGWGQRWAQLPLRFLMDPVIRVTFPAYSRLQKEKERMKNALERSVFFVNLFIFPILAGMGLAMPKVVNIFPQYQKWLVGLIPFYWYLANFAFGTATTPLVNAFNAVGKIKVSLKLMVFWTVLTWLLVPGLAKFRGVNGAAFGLFLVSASSFLAWWLAKKEFQISLKKTILLPLFLASIMALVLLAVNNFLPQTFLGLALFILIGVLIYLILLFLFVKKELVWFQKSLLALVKK